MGRGSRSGRKMRKKDEAKATTSPATTTIRTTATLGANRFNDERDSLSITLH